MNKWIGRLVIVILASATLILYGTNFNLRIQERYEDSIPDIELKNTLSFYDKESSAVIGEISGFVLFPDINDQPKNGTRQYYVIRVINELDENGNFKFLLEEYIKMSSISVRKTNSEILKVTSNTPQSITLESDSGQTFKINKQNKLVNIMDVDGDITTLITDDNEFRKFQLDFLK